jgi:hypothetical protein
MTTTSTITSEIEKVASKQKVMLAPLSDHLVLPNSGSLCFAILVARLEDELGVDPYTALDDVSFPVTLGDFVKACDNAVQ